MKRFLTIVLFAVVASLGFGLQSYLSVQAAVGACSCPKGKVCCYNCNGSFAFCSRSHAFCPECPAP